MGLVFGGIPYERAEFLRRVGGYDEFVETGTFLGGSALWAADRFARVQTVEASPAFFEQARARLAARTNVTQHLGRSQDVLRSLAPALRGPALFWLDAHWSEGGTYGEGEDCPLLAELEIVLAGAEHAVLVDDARLFLRPPPRPHDWRRWPHVDAICERVRTAGGGRYFVSVTEDVLYCLPRRLEAAWCDELAVPPPPPDFRTRWARRFYRWISGRRPSGFVD